MPMMICPACSKMIFDAKDHICGAPVLLSGPDTPLVKLTDVQKQTQDVAMKLFHKFIEEISTEPDMKKHYEKHSPFPSEVIDWIAAYLDTALEDQKATEIVRFKSFLLLGLWLAGQSRKGILN